MNGLEMFGPLANLTAVGALIGLVIWMVTRGFPALLDRADDAQTEARQEFLAALDRQTDQRAEAVRSGHALGSRLQQDLGRMAAEMQRRNDNDVRRHATREQHSQQLKGQPT